VVSAASARTSWVLMTTATLVVLFWLLSIANPCLVAHLRSANPADGNPIAITQCRVAPGGYEYLTNGDVVVRVGALIVLMGIFALAWGLVDPPPTKRRLALVTAIAAATGFVVIAALTAVVYPVGAVLGFLVAEWAGTTVIAVVAVLCGAALADAALQTE
jgi:hypothetical protein